jgi:hypothetical protein
MTCTAFEVKPSSALMRSSSAWSCSSNFLPLTTQPLEAVDRILLAAMADA